MKTKLMTIAILATLLASAMHISASSKDEPEPIERLNIRFLNGNSDLGQPNPAIYGDTDTKKYAPKIELTIKSTGEVIHASADQQDYSLNIPVHRANTTLKAKVRNAKSMAKYIDNAQINAHSITSNLFAANTVDGNTAHLVFRMMGQGPKHRSVHFGFYAQSKKETDEQVKKELENDNKLLKKRRRRLKNRKSLEEEAYFRVPLLKKRTYAESESTESLEKRIKANKE